MDHHSEYLARAVAALTPEGRARVDELLDELVQAGAGDRWIVRFARVREVEADSGEPSTAEDPGLMLSDHERDELITGFTTIRDQERLDDVSDWANAVIALLEDESRGYIV